MLDDGAKFKIPGSASWKLPSKIEKNNGGFTHTNASIFNFARYLASQSFDVSH